MWQQPCCQLPALLLLSLAQRPLLGQTLQSSCVPSSSLGGRRQASSRWRWLIFLQYLKNNQLSARPTRPSLLFTRCLVLSPLFSKPCKGWAAGIRAQVPAELGQWGQIWQAMVLPEKAQDPLEAGQPGEGLWGAK